MDGKRLWTSELLKGKKPEEIVGPNGLSKQLRKALLERAMNAELTHHLRYEKGDRRLGKRQQS